MRKRILVIEDQEDLRGGAARSLVPATLSLPPRMALAAGDRHAVVGASSRPRICAKKSAKVVDSLLLAGIHHRLMQSVLGRELRDC